MAITEQEKQIRSERMKAMWASGQMGKNKNTPEPAHRLSIPVESKPAKSVPPPDKWVTLPIAEAQQEIAKLKKEYEHALRVINQRLMEPKMFACYICGTEMRDGQQRGSDFTSTDPKTGLLILAHFCSELCWNRHQKNQIEQKLASSQRG